MGKITRISLIKIEKNEFAMLFPYGPQARSCKFGFVFDGTKDDFIEESTHWSLNHREAEHLWIQVENQLPDLEDCKSVRLQLEGNNYWIVKDSPSSVILICKENNQWMKFTKKCLRWDLKKEYFDIKADEVAAFAKARLSVDFKSSLCPKGDPGIGSFIYWDNSAVYETARI